MIRIIENSPQSEPDGLKLQKNEEADIIYALVDEIRKNKALILRGEKFYLGRIRSLFQDFARLFNIHILQREENGRKFISFKFYTNPKKLFHGSLIETEEKFVAFIDILGFSEMIKEYDNNPLSDLLQDIHSALNQALDETVRKFKDDIFETFLEHKLFSDCLCVSIPFFNSKADYFSAFNILFSLVKTYQNNMMKKGYYVRGAIAVGSYFSDDNMIFSGGLVKAYNLESKKAIYPRIIIEQSIILKLREFHPISFPKGLSQEIIHSPKENLFFVNPFVNVKQGYALFKDMVADIARNPELPDLDESDKELIQKGKDGFIEFLNLLYDSSSEEESDRIQVEEMNTVLESKISLLRPSKKISALKRIRFRFQSEQVKIGPYEKLIWLREFNEWYLNRKNSKKFEVLE